jgi:hypothetical protein
MRSPGTIIGVSSISRGYDVVVLGSNDIIIAGRS